MTFGQLSISGHITKVECTSQEDWAEPNVKQIVNLLVQKSKNVRLRGCCPIFRELGWPAHTEQLILSKSISKFIIPDKKALFGRLTHFSLLNSFTTDLTFLKRETNLHSISVDQE